MSMFFTIPLMPIFLETQAHVPDQKYILWAIQPLLIPNGSHY